jgi:polyisoprenoid-binding protein YceI
MTARLRTRHWKRWLTIGVAVLAIAVVGGPYVYIHFIEGKAPPPLAFTSPFPSGTDGTATTSGQSGTTPDGTWTVTSDSVVGYRVNEVLFGQNNAAVGRTSAVTRSITIDGTTVTAATFTIDLTTGTSDQSRRDGQFNGRIMDTATYPTATFTLTAPIQLGSIPDVGASQTVQARGDLILHGVTRAVAFELAGRYADSTVQVAGSIPITFADWGIPNPSFGPVTTEDHGLLEFSLDFTRG